MSNTRFILSDALPNTNVRVMSGSVAARAVHPPSIGTIDPCANDLWCDGAVWERGVLANLDVCAAFESEFRVGLFNQVFRVGLGHAGLQRT